MKKNKIIILSIIILLVLTILFMPNALALKTYETVGTSTGLVTASLLNVRSGPRNNI
ncbi:MAG: hypothetical protein LBL91_02030 [Lachnospiraceae bacterium]|jgi:hypothetical protein|nr:hypothetical protein [Lachnospiraceae bacterium]